MLPARLERGEQEGTRGNGVHPWKILTYDIEHEACGRAVDEVGTTGDDLPFERVLNGLLGVEIAIPRVVPGDQLEPRRRTYGAEPVPPEATEQAVARADGFRAKRVHRILELDFAAGALTMQDRLSALITTRPTEFEIRRRMNDHPS